MHAAAILLFYSAIFVALAESPKNSAKVDFNRDIRPILSENCYKCHGPDDGARKAKLRFDLRAEALKPAKSGRAAIVPGSPGDSELVARITAADLDDRMPPAKTGKTLTSTQIELLRRWIAGGAPYAKHWAYVKPVLPAVPEVKDKNWPVNSVDRFILARLENEGLKPSPPAEKSLLIRRVSLDLTGLPPTPEEVERFLKDRSPRAYHELVDRLLNKPSFGEHWARLWLDLARYADSAGYADDPPRTIWAYRDYVIKAFNSNKPFDRFTLEQIAGDLLDDSDDDDLIGTAFHRNTMTNNEGGTSDEEFRNAAIVDRVNTTMAVWMATSMACAQCHNHKYDPITQQDYFSLFAILNNTADADLKDESPVLDLYTPTQKEQRKNIQAEVLALEKTFKTSTPESLAAQEKWEKNFPGGPEWQPLEPVTVKAETGGTAERVSENTFKIAPQLKTETYHVNLAQTPKRLAGLRIEALPTAQPLDSEQSANAGFSLSRVSAQVIGSSTKLAARYVHLELPGPDKYLSLAEVQVFRGRTNLALHGEASQSSTAFDAPAHLAIDDNTNGDFEVKSTTHTELSKDPWWEVDLKQSQPVDRITIWNRTDHELQSRLAGVRLQLLDDNRKLLWERTLKQAPEPKTTYGLNGTDPVEFVTAYADTREARSDPASVIVVEEQGQQGQKKKKGWVVNTEDGKPHSLTLLMARPLELAPDSRLEVILGQTALHDQCPPALFKISVSDDERMAEYAAAPASILEILASKPEARSKKQRAALSEYYRANVALELKPERERYAALKKQLSDMPANTVPVMRELIGDKRRKTHLQLRGNYLSTADEVTEATPSAFHTLPSGCKPDRLALAHWLVDPENPLTARVLANRLWEQIFGIGIVRTSEDFGSQGELPSYPEFLDWLACQLREGSAPSPGGEGGGEGDRDPRQPKRTQPWDLKAFLRLLVTSRTYCQSSKVTPEMLRRDPENLLLARGPRFRMSAEVIRDQALAISGLLSQKMYGPPVRPPQPALGLTAAFGGSLDWKTSEGEDRYRRALYTEWRRTSPYPSMAAFDAPNREVCALRRTRSNTPLQALVTLNDPVYVEAAAALGRRLADAPGSKSAKAEFGFRLCLAREPHDNELRRLLKLFDQAYGDYVANPALASELLPTTLSKTLSQTSSKILPASSKPPSDGGLATPKLLSVGGLAAPKPLGVGGSNATPTEAVTKSNKRDRQSDRQSGRQSDKAGKPEPAELAAWTAVANVLLNLDETLMRP